MWNVIGITGLIGFSVFLVISIVFIFTRWRGLVKNLLIGSGICFVIMFVGAIISSNTKEPVTSNAEQPPKSVIEASLKSATATRDKKITAKVIHVVDGDTIDVDLGDGKKETVHMLLVDTPETVNPSKSKQPYGEEASSFTKESLEGKVVQLEGDVTERDKYGRLLFYVYLGDKMFNELLLEKGLARVEVYPPDVKYLDRFRQVQNSPQKMGLGIWGIENYAREDGFHDEVVSKLPAATPFPTLKPPSTPMPATPKPTPIPTLKPTPTATLKKSTNVYYSNCTAARAAGAAPVRRGDPGYGTHLDRDRDGIGCE